MKGQIPWLGIQTDGCESLFRLWVFLWGGPLTRGFVCKMGPLFGWTFVLRNNHSSDCKSNVYPGGRDRRGHRWRGGHATTFCRGGLPFCPPPARRLDAVVPDKFKGYGRVLGWHAEVHQWKPLQRVGTLPSRDSESGDRRPRAAQAPQVRALWEGRPGDEAPHRCFHRPWGRPYLVPAAVI